MEDLEADAIKDAQRRMWSVGDYPEVAKTLLGAAEALLGQAGVRPGELVLDVATGTGNVAVAAAQAGARVSGLDLTPELLTAARRRAEEAGLQIDWVEGDAEQLPFDAASFDCVTSCFGVMFAPRHQLAAAELTRVARPGARVAVSAWTPQGLNGKMFATIASYMPPPPSAAIPSVMWGDEDHVRTLFAASGAVLSFQRRTVSFTHDSPESWLKHNERVLPPMALARAALEPRGRWGQLEAELIGLFQEANEAGDGTLRMQAEYLLTIARLPA